MDAAIPVMFLAVGLLSCLWLSFVLYQCINTGQLALCDSKGSVWVFTVVSGLAAALLYRVFCQRIRPVQSGSVHIHSNDWANGTSNDSPASQAAHGAPRYYADRRQHWPWKDCIIIKSD